MSIRLVSKYVAIKKTHQQFFLFDTNYYLLVLLIVKINF